MMSDHYFPFRRLLFSIFYIAVLMYIPFIIQFDVECCRCGPFGQLESTTRTRVDIEGAMGGAFPWVVCTSGNAVPLHGSTSPWHGTESRSVY